MINTSSQHDTICAIASGLAPAAIGVIRISGPDTRQLLRNVARFHHTPTWTPHKSHVADIVIDGRLLDEVCVVVHPNPNSYTGEDLCEIFTHGNPLIMKTLIDHLCQLGARLANPGEFTQRAYLNGRMDLVKAEAVLDIVTAKSLSAVHNSQRILRGGVSEQIHALRDTLFTTHATLEAGIEFDESMEGFRITCEATVQTAIASVAKLRKTYATGQLLKDGVKVVIVGKPNVGKSTLFNCLLQDDRAIITDHPGTTRDFNRETMIISGICVALYDCAGIRATDDPVETIGVDRAISLLHSADIILFMLDISHPITEADHRIAQTIPPSRSVVTLLNKSDIKVGGAHPEIAGPNPIEITATAPHTRETVIEAIAAHLPHLPISDTDLYITSRRQYDLLTQTASHLSETAEALASQQPDDIVAYSLRQAIFSLEEITGHRTVDDMLGYIFSQFCIGK